MREVYTWKSFVGVLEWECDWLGREVPTWLRQKEKGGLVGGAGLGVGKSVVAGHTMAD